MSDRDVIVDAIQDVFRETTATAYEHVDRDGPAMIRATATGAILAGIAIVERMVGPGEGVRLARDLADRFKVGDASDGH